MVSAAHAADSDAEAQRVVVNLVLAEDGALGGVVTALGGLGSQILALRKSEPTLEDVFVELVGRGFADEAEDPGAPDHRRPGADGDGAGDGETRSQAANPSAEEAEEAHPIEAGR